MVDKKNLCEQVLGSNSYSGKDVCDLLCLIGELIDLLKSFVCVWYYIGDIHYIVSL